ncbi:MAG: sigma-70 family RNA polymerase sigma factor [Burkholderiaceae bacterium]|nr:sigma-70 family RNA polymerase sigma factor [Burkholderiaceae bacterium]
MVVSERVTVLLARVTAGDRAARDALFAAVYPELRRLAHARLYGGGRNTVLDTTALVHESYLRLVQTGELSFDDRRAFFGYASRVMRSVIVDSARARLAERRGGDARPVTLADEPAAALLQQDEHIMQVHEALQQLEQADARAAQMVEMRYLGGYSDKEIAETLDVTERTVQRDWEKARMLLRALLGEN